MSHACLTVPLSGHNHSISPKTLKDTHGNSSFLCSGQKVVELTCFGFVFIKRLKTHLFTEHLKNPLVIVSLFDSHTSSSQVLAQWHSNPWPIYPCIRMFLTVRHHVPIVTHLLRRKVAIKLCQASHSYLVMCHASISFLLNNVCPNSSLKFSDQHNFLKRCLIPVQTVDQQVCIWQVLAFV